jgi:hypothetical protein
LKLLIKFPSRERRQKFFSVLNIYLYNLKDLKDIKFLITLDEDDESMNNDTVKSIFKFMNKMYGDIFEIDYGVSKNKIHAVNRFPENYKHDWDILMLISDDMLPVISNFNKDIMNYFEENISDTDGILNTKDGFQDRINTLPIIGKKYYEQFNYIYYPEYKSFFCDEELTNVAKSLNKYYTMDKVLIRHEHPVWTGKGNDALYMKNQKDWDYDEKLYNERSKKVFIK